jgi:4-azaleucine resistance transporter AzlC
MTPDRVPPAATVTEQTMDLATARRRLLSDASGLAVSGLAFGIVYGIAARAAGFEPIDAIASSLIVFAGAAQFAAVGLVAAGAALPLIVLTTLFLNVRHLLYAAALRPSVASRGLLERAAMAHVLTDEAFAVATVHFQRLGRPDHVGYWIAAVATDYIPWNAGTIIGVLGGSVIPDPATFGLDVVFPAAMAGIAVGLVKGHRDLLAAASGIVIAIVVGLLSDPRLGIIVGGLLGALVALVAPVGEPEAADVPPAGDPMP